MANNRPVVREGAVRLAPRSGCLSSTAAHRIPTVRDPRSWAMQTCWPNTIPQAANLRPRTVPGDRSICSDGSSDNTRTFRVGRCRRVGRVVERRLANGDSVHQPRAVPIRTVSGRSHLNVGPIDRFEEFLQTRESCAVSLLCLREGVATVFKPSAERTAKRGQCLITCLRADTVDKEDTQREWLLVSHGAHLLRVETRG